MKTHAIIPIFIPHMGCKESCVFCNQNQITARAKAPSPDEVKATIDEWLQTLTEIENVEIAFYGGSFTAIPISMQENYLRAAEPYLASGAATALHISTRPDCIDDEILEMLISYGVKTIELGVQSFSDEVLRRSKRGHSSKEVYEACSLIKNKGIDLGIQLMVGLPGDSLETSIFSAEETVKLRPKLARIYPTLVLKDTELMDMYESGEYTPLSRDEALIRSKAIYEILSEAGITIMRVGLKSTDLISSERLGSINSGAYHPAFRQLVEGEIAKDRILELLEKRTSEIGSDEGESGAVRKLEIRASGSWISNAVGHNGCNREFLEKEYPNLTFSFRTDDSLAPGEIVIR